MPSRKYNPEKRTWRGRSHRKGGDNIRQLKEKQMNFDEPTMNWPKEIIRLNDEVARLQKLCNTISQTAKNRLDAYRKLKDGIAKHKEQIESGGYGMREDEHLWNLLDFPFEG